jgi:hypothetical protein
MAAELKSVIFKNATCITYAEFPPPVPSSITRFQTQEITVTTLVLTPLNSMREKKKSFPPDYTEKAAGTKVQ